MEAMLAAHTRDRFGKNENRQLRRQGMMPAVVYGGEAAGERPTGTPIAVDPKVLMQILHSESGVNTIIGLQVDGGEPAKVLVKEYQLDPISHKLLHADFFRIAMDRTLQVTVPILLRGEAKGVKQQGGVLDFVHRDIEVECLPTDIPEHIDVDVTELLIGQHVRVRDLARDARWTPITDPDVMIVHVVPPRAEPVPAEAEVAAPVAPAEPELIKKGKAEEPEAEN